jgi:hypothetical protein
MMSFWRENKGGMRDLDVRKALHSRVLRDHHGDPNTLVLNELGLRHGRCRVDVAVVNGSLHGYELKSDKDTLERLSFQVETYGKVLDRATLVVGERHAEKAIPMLPDWWGIKVASQGIRGGISFEHYRPASLNTEVDPIALAELLWQVEVVAILSNRGVTGADLRKPRAHQYRLLTELLKLNELRDQVRVCLKSRENWRGQKPSL